MKAPETTAAASDYLQSLDRLGVPALLRNGEGLSIQILRTGGQTVPVVLSDGRRGKPALFSPQAHYLDYPIHEIARSSKRWTHGRLQTLLSPLAALFQIGRIDRVVHVNHWLFNGGPPLRLDRRQLADLLDCLRARYPRHAFVFPAVVPDLAPRLIRDLTALGGLAVQSRIVHLLDPARSLRGRALASMRHTRRKDAALLSDREASLVDKTTLLREHAGRVWDLYGKVYLEKHPDHLNPQYTPAFFEMLLGSDLFAARGWLDGRGELVAFNIQSAFADAIHWSVGGYDTAAPSSQGLFRVVMADDVASATRQGRVLNWGGGNAAFKRHRGAEPVFEYDIVFADHLSAFRRLPWQILHHGRSLKSGAPRKPRATARWSGRQDAAPAGARMASPSLRMALVTSNPSLAGPLLRHAALRIPGCAVTIPLVVWLRPSMRLSDRVRNLARTVRRQAVINRTTAAAQLLHHFFFRWLASTRKQGPTRSSVARLPRGRSVVEGSSGNEAHVVSALRGSGCAVGVIVGGDVLSPATIAGVQMPLFNVHFSDPALVRGLPPVFWEIHEGRDFINLTFHRVTSRLDAGDVILQREVPIVWEPTLAGTMRATRRLASAELAGLVVDGLGLWREGADAQPVVRLGPLRTVPRVGQALRAARICREKHALQRRRSVAMPVAG
jgi:hypothetical protein